MRSTIGSNAEFWRRLAFTVGVLGVARVVYWIPVPGIDSDVLAQLYQRPHGLGPVSIGRLGINPYLSVSFLVLILTTLSKRLRTLATGRIELYTRGLTLVLVIVEAYGVARGLGLSRAVPEPGVTFTFSAVVTLAGTSFALIWLAEQITVRGIGNGFALMLLVPLVVRMPESFYRLFQDDRAAFLPTDVVRTAVVAFVGLVVLVVLIESAQLRIPVRYARGPREAAPPNATSWLRFKLNNAGVLPIYFTGWMLLLPSTIKSAYGLEDGVIAKVATAFAWASPGREAAGAVLMAIFSFCYVALLLNPRKMAQDLERYGGIIPGVAPGQSSADYLDRVLTWITLVSALYLWAVSMLPFYFASIYRVPVTFGGVSLLVVVAVAMDTLRQARAFWPAGASARRIVDDGLR